MQLYGVFTYIKEIRAGNNKPNRISWLMWSIAPMIATFAALTKGVGWSVLPVFMSGFGPMLVFIASCFTRDAYWKIDRFDYACGLFSLLALVLWIITKEPSIAIVFAIASDGFAAIPTIFKAWKHPETETIGPYTTGIFNVFTSIPGLRTLSFAEIAFPIYLICVNSCILFSILREKMFQRKK